MYRKEHDLKNFILGPMQMVFASGSFAFMSYFAKLATKELAGPQVTFFRLFTGSLVAMIIIMIGGSKLINQNTKVLVWRGLLGGCSALLFFIALEKGTVTNSVVLQNTYPIFAAIISIYALKEKVSLRLFTLLAITFSGVVVLVRPDISNIKAGDILALISGFIGGFAITTVRKLRKEHESVWTIFFYFCFFGAIISLFMALPYWKWPGNQGWIFLILTSILGLIGQVCMTSAYKYCSATTGGILSMSTSAFSFLIGVILMREGLLIYDFIGISLIIMGNVLAIATMKN